MLAPGASEALLSNGLPITLAGLGYKAVCVMHSSSVWSCSQLIACRIERSERSGTEEYESDEQEWVEDGAELSLPSALAELGLAHAPPPSWSEVVSTYRVLARRYHPDRFESMDLPIELRDAALKKFLQIQAAFAYLRERQNGAS